MSSVGISCLYSWRGRMAIVVNRGRYGRTAWALKADGRSWATARAAQVVRQGEVMPDPAADALVALACSKPMPPNLVASHLVIKASLLYQRAQAAKKRRRAAKTKSRSVPRH